MKARFFVFFILTLSANHMFAQHKYEREFRIKKSQMPIEALQLLDTNLEGAKRLKFYKEIDSTKNSYEAKFKKGKLWYSIAFDVAGKPEDVEITIQTLDISSDIFSNIKNYFSNTFEKHRIKKIQQQYPTSETESLKQILSYAFQNMLIPTVNYEIVVAGKNDKNYLEYEILFDAQGKFKHSRERLPPNYDHVLY